MVIVIGKGCVPHKKGLELRWGAERVFSETVQEYASSPININPTHKVTGLMNQGAEIARLLRSLTTHYL